MVQRPKRCWIHNSEGRWQGSIRVPVSGRGVSKPRRGQEYRISYLKLQVLGCYLVIDWCCLVSNCFVIDIRIFDSDALLEILIVYGCTHMQWFLLCLLVPQASGFISVIMKLARGIGFLSFTSSEVLLK